MYYYSCCLFPVAWCLFSKLYCWKHWINFVGRHFLLHYSGFGWRGGCFIFAILDDLERDSEKYYKILTIWAKALFIYSPVTHSFLLSSIALYDFFPLKGCWSSLLHLLHCSVLYWATSFQLCGPWREGSSFSTWLYSSRLDISMYSVINIDDPCFDIFS